MLVGTDVCVRMVFLWEEAGVPGENPHVWLGDHMTISHADAGFRTRVAAVRVECVNASQTAEFSCVPLLGGCFFCSGLNMWFLGFKECLQCFNVRTVKVCYCALLLVIETRIWDFNTLYLFQTSSTVQASTDYESDALPSAPHRPYVCKRTYHLGHLYSKITSIVCQNLYPLVSEMSSFQNVDISTL